MKKKIELNTVITIICCKEYTVLVVKRYRVVQFSEFKK